MNTKIPSEDEVSKTPPDWKAIAYELASLLDDIDLQFQTEAYLDKNESSPRFYMENPRSVFLIKKFMAAQKYFRRYKNELLYIDDYENKKREQQKLQNMFYESLTPKNTTHTP